jgi:sulfatase maturation enzyme AslB (radical SAM superfamily)
MGPPPLWQSIFPDTHPPVFLQEHDGYSLFYAPGWVVKVPVRLKAGFILALGSPSGGDQPKARELLRRASQSEYRWEEIHTHPFEPFCLTLYLNNNCNMDCRYCFSEPDESPSTRLSLEAIRSAAEIVIRNCRAKGKTLTVVFHGGGEPTLDHELIIQSLDWLEERARQCGLAIFRYLATSGTLSPVVEKRLATRFDLIGISCDGPADIQEAQRPFRKPGKRSSAWYMEQTARAVHAAGKPLHVRVTVTPTSMLRQPEIAEYICCQLKPKEIAVEPVYNLGRSKGSFAFEADQAEAYVKAFLKAQAVASRYGIRLSASGSRPGEIHDAYCHLWRDVLNLTPEGVATNCFALSRARDVQNRGLDLGGWDGSSSRFSIDPNRVETLRRTLSREPAECAACFNRYSCARQCPEVCRADSQEPGQGFRCRVNARLADAAIQRAVSQLDPWAILAEGPVIS